MRTVLTNAMFVRSCSRLLFAVLVVFGFSVPSAFSQSLAPGGPTDLGSIALGTSNTVTLTFSVSTTTTIVAVVATTEGVTGQDYSIASQNCVGTLNPGSTCSIQVKFTPKQIGVRHGYLAISNGSGNMVAHTYLHGIGLGGQLVYTPDTVIPITALGSLVPDTFKPAAFVIDAGGDEFFDDIANSRILELSASTGNYTVIANSITGNSRSSMVIGGDGTLYVSSPTSGVVYAFLPGKMPAVLSTGSVTLVTPTGLATDGLGFLYIADAGTNKIVRVALDGSGSTTLALTATLSSPGGLAVDSANNLYIADSGNDRIVEFGLVSGITSVVAVSGLTLNNPSGLGLDAAGTLYIADTANSRIVVSPPSLPAFALATAAVKLVTPTAVAVDSKGNLMLADPGLGLVSVNRSTLGISFPTSTHVGNLDTTDGAKTFTVQNTGNLVLALNPPSSGQSPSISTSAFAFNTAVTTCPLLSTSSPSGTPSKFALGYSCTYGVQFTPIATGNNNAVLSIATTDAGTTGLTYKSTVSLSGIGNASLSSFTITASPNTTTLGVPVSYTITALNSSGATATDYRGTVTLTSTDSKAVFLSGLTYTFTFADAGIHTFSAVAGVAFHTVGTFTITATDGAIHATSNTVRVYQQPGISLTSSVNPIFVGASTRLTATVTAPTGTPTGSVTFYSTASTGATPVTLGTATLATTAPYTATFAATLPVAGTPCLTAVYSGDSTNASVTSSAVCETVEDFALANAPNATGSVTVDPGKPAVFNLLVSPVGGSTLLAPVALSVQGVPSNFTYSITPVSIAANASATPVTLTITPPFTAIHSTTLASRRNALAPITVALLGIPLLLLRRRRFAPWLVLLGFVASLTALTGCSGTSGGYYLEPNPKTYVITVLATSSTISHTTTVNLTVQ